MPEAKDILKAIETARTLYDQAGDVADSIKGLKNSYDDFQETLSTGKQKLEGAVEAVQNGDISGALKLTIGSITDLNNPLQDIRSTVGHAVLDKSTEKLGALCTSITGYDVDLDKMSSGLSNMASTAETGVGNFIQDPSISTALEGVKNEALSTEDVTTSVLKPIAEFVAKEGVEWAVRALGEAATDAVAAALSETVIGSVAAEVVGKVATEVAAEVAGHVAENVAGTVTEEGVGGAYKVGGTAMDVVTGKKDMSDIPQDIGNQLANVTEKGVTSAISSVADPLTKVPGMSTDIPGMSTNIPSMDANHLPNSPKPSITDTLKPSPSDAVEVDQSLKADGEKTGLKLDVFSGETGTQMENRLGTDISGHGTTRTSTSAHDTSLNDLSHSDASKMKPEPEPQKPKSKSPFSIPNPNERPGLRPDENE